VPPVRIVYSLHMDRQRILFLKRFLIVLGVLRQGSLAAAPRARKKQEKKGMLLIHDLDLSISTLD
jgi:hypothetical protein